MRRIEQSILYDILNIRYSMLLLFDIRSIENNPDDCALCSYEIFLTITRPSLSSKLEMLALFTTIWS